MLLKSENTVNKVNFTLKDRKVFIILYGRHIDRGGGGLGTAAQKHPAKLHT